jgi:hypothetical protein
MEKKCRECVRKAGAGQTGIDLKDLAHSTRPAS